jgi:formate hydrogenlyase subunit 7
MMPATAAPFSASLPVFHLRLGGCGGCADMVDAALRGRGRGTPVAVECSSPRQAALVIVTGVWSEGLASSARAVVAQAPRGARILAVGDCSGGLGELADSLGGIESAAEQLAAGAVVRGCPPSVREVLEGVRDVSS